MKDYKIATVAVLVVMMFCSAPLFVVDVDAIGQPTATATSTGLGEFNIYFQIDGNVDYDSSQIPVGSVDDWVGYLGQGTDGYIALIDVLSDIELTSGKTIDSAFFVTSPYITNNTSYGEITQLFGLSNDDENCWKVFVYKDNSWVAGVNAVGLYQPFSDYTVDYRVSNIALYYGAVDSDISIVGLDILPLTVVPSNSQGSNASDYQVSFIFEYTKDGVDHNVTATGYGSNGFTALQNAIGINAATGVVGSSNYDTYGWITTLFGLGTVQTAGEDTPDDWTDDQYTYWNLYYDDPSTSAVDWTYSNFTTAFYGSIDSSVMHADSFRFVYA